MINPLKVLTLILALLGIVYIAEMTSLSTQGYEIQTLQKELQEVRQDKTYLNMLVAQSGSISYLRDTDFVREEMVSSEFLFVDGDTALVQR
jgi:hypothetical protein